MKLNDDLVFLIGFALGAAFTFVFILLMWDTPREIQHVRKEAVRVGVARYIADADGNASFTWILPAEISSEKK